MRSNRPVGLISITTSEPRPEAAAGPAADPVLDRTIGDFIREVRQLSDAQVEEIVRYQGERGLRFGEAAVALDLASRDDVLWALSQQFHYPYPAAEGVGFNPELVAATDPFGAQAEAFRGMRSQLLLGEMSPDKPRRALAMLSANVGDGKSFFAANLAIVFSQLGDRTLLIDADMRTPRLHQLFNVPNDYGLSGILSGRAEADAIHSVAQLPSLFVLPVGTLPPNPLELLQRQAFSRLLAELLSKFDHVIVDTPAATHGADARVLAAKCGAAMFIGRRDTTRMKAVHALVSEVARGPGKVAGVVINEH